VGATKQCLSILETAPDLCDVALTCDLPKHMFCTLSQAIGHYQSNGHCTVCCVLCVRLKVLWVEMGTCSTSTLHALEVVADLAFAHVSSVSLL